MSFKTMYPSKNNSPSTVLSVACTASDTDIVVESTSVLPPAPNLAVLGSDESAEIICYTAASSNILSGVTRGINGTVPKAWAAGTNVARNFTTYDHDTFINNISELKEVSDNAVENIDDLISRVGVIETDIADLGAQMAFKRYGVTNVGESGNALTRTLDAVGMSWSAVADTNGNYNIISDFDNAAPWMWRKCVGFWTLENGAGKFNVTAYLGDANYNETGSAGDYVAVEVPLSFFKRSSDGKTLEVSSHQYPGYRPFEIFWIDRDETNLLDKVYLPAYSLGVDESGNGASRPGLDNAQGHYHYLLELARTYGNGTLGNVAMLEPSALQDFLYIMFTVETATQQADDFAKGCINLRHNNVDVGVFLDDTNFLISNYIEGRVINESVAIVPTNVDRNAVDYYATHKIVSVTRCDSTGTASDSGSYTLVEIDAIPNRDYFNYDISGETQYRFTSRPWPTGECNVLTAPSGYIVDNDGFHPMRYRYIENMYGNQYNTTMDFFATEIKFSDGGRGLEHYLLKDPKSYTPSSESKPDLPELQSDIFEKLDIVTTKDIMAGGFFAKKKFEDKYPNTWIPGGSGGSATTYFCDSSFIATSSPIRIRKNGGYWSSGSAAGPSAVAINYSPSAGQAYYGGSLYFYQK